MNIVSSLWYKVITLGTTGEKRFIRENRKIISSNLAAIVFLIICLPYIPYYYYLNLKDLSVLLSIVTILLIYTPFLNFLRMPMAARIWLILISNFSCYQFAVACGKESGIHYVILSLSTFPFLLFSLKNKQEIVFLSSLSVFLFFMVQYDVFTASIIKLDNHIANKIYYPTIIVSFLLLLLIMLYISYENEAAERALIRFKGLYEREIKEARKVIDQNQNNNNYSIAEVLLQQIKDLHVKKEYLKNIHFKLKKTNNDLDNFIYTVSHDLKYPISNIEGLLNVLISQASYKDEVFRDAVNMISKSVARFKNTIGELTEITKIQGNSSEASVIHIDKLVKDIFCSLKCQIEESNTQFLLEINCPRIYFSRKNLRSILYNLISNAIKYRSPDRDPIIEISISIGRTSNLEIIVKDNGLGIHESHHDKIFSMFRRVHDHVEGSGVGLYIVKRIIDNNGGRITLNSEVDKGSQFILELKPVKVDLIKKSEDC